MQIIQKNLQDGTSVLSKGKKFIINIMTMARNKVRLLVFRVSSSVRVELGLRLAYLREFWDDM